MVAWVQRRSFWCFVFAILTELVIVWKENMSFFHLGGDYFFFSKCCGDPSFTSRSSDSFPNAHVCAHSPMQTHVHTHTCAHIHILCITLISPLTHTHTCNHLRTRSRLSFSLPLYIFLSFVLASDKTLLSVLGHPFIYSDIAIF